MSLILDALRKSAAERERGFPPGLHADLGMHPRRRPSRRVPIALAVLAGAGGATTLAVFGLVEEPAGGLARVDPVDAGRIPGFPGPTEPPTLAESRPMQVPLAAPRAEERALQPALGDASVPVRGASVSMSGGAAALLPAPLVGAYTPEPTWSAEPSRAGSEVPAPAAEAPTAEAPSTRSGPAALPVPEVAAPAAAAMPMPVEKLPTLDELDHAFRKSLPPLEVSMLVYGDDPARRFAIIDGKRLPGSDGGRTLGNVTLVEVRADGLVLEAEGRRFLLPRLR